MKPIKDILRSIREDRDLKQKDIAKVLGINQQYYSKYETGEYEMPCRHIITLCKFYNITADYLLGLVDYELPISSLSVQYKDKPDMTNYIVNGLHDLTTNEKFVLYEVVKLIKNKENKSNNS